jgi:hypothetical protein
MSTDSQLATAEATMTCRRKPPQALAVAVVEVDGS